ncbi:hydrolase, partial [Xanthomonas citri pv. citri]|nr:hydrolase [Xanthomonas citri pv. citri]
MTKQVYIIHGYRASSTNHWFPWLKKRLLADGVQA